ncbi:MAG: uroporphyrinogen-III synthase [Rickettsiales bacterium]|nr:uroporphyrinogen-III synthase [Rickettsiales bacterium]
MKNILLTRPHKDSYELATLLEKDEFNTFIEPLFSVKKIAINQKADAKTSAVIITSANACDAVIDFGFNKNIKIFSVGKKTAQKLIDANFTNIVTSPRNSAESLKNLIAREKHEKILYFHGSVVTLDFSKELKNVEKILAYETFPAENFSPEFLQISQEQSFDQVLLFSQNSAQTFCKLAAKHNLLEYFATSQILCLSDKILACVKKFGFTNSSTFSDFPTLKKFYD